MLIVSAAKFDSVQSKNDHFMFSCLMEFVNFYENGRLNCLI